MLLMADSNNSSIKLFNTQGEHIDSLCCSHYPFRLAVLDSGSYSRPLVAVTLPHCPAIDILKVDDNKVKKERTIETSRRYFAVAALDATTLAVGYHRRPGIDLINLSGEVLREIRSRERVFYMEATEDGDLLCCAAGNKILRVRVDPVDVVLYKLGLLLSLL
ncbi:hypothetical protein PoB_006060300 [Plakobranchus ocellatus]|uniref:Uncharacterized protein n=1 Tax=Plakobranchus ocellatus TaxID=259542 RepID=A0AAV4CQE5_9GAST|nr:hypothetical protein PoB_006060300 [Plakobranchus ocellatus]